MFLFAAFLWGLDMIAYGWMLTSAVAIPVLIYIIRRIRKRMLQVKVRSMWLEEDFIP
jgi:hypothetical protein